MRRALTFRRATLAEILELRHAVLRPGLPREAAAFEGDDEDATRHFGAFAPSGEILGCLSLMRRPWRGADAHQLRGMATDPTHGRSGVGRALLAYALGAVAEETGIAVAWCNARTEAAGFYRRLGWEIVSGPFDIPGVGPHYLMLRRGA
jgi:N-acetylglutamate synthase-like GNAT family acetyltransferase